MSAVARNEAANERAGAALRFSAGKPRFSLLWLPFVMSMIAVLEFGCKKYAAWNWVKSAGTDDHTQFVTDRLDSLFRHLRARLSGERIDPETGETHMAAVAVNAMFVAYYDENETRNG